MTSCKKFIEVDAPNTSLNIKNVYSTDATAAAVLTAIYTDMSAANTDLAGSNSISNVSLLAGLGADELTLYNSNNTTLADYYRNDLSETTIFNYWGSLYKIIFATNNALNGLESSTSLTPAIKQQLLGEARFIRAFCYFYLVNLFGDAPLVLDLNYKTNSLLSRTSSVRVYDQIVKDLKDSQQMLSTDYLQGDAFTHYANGAEERVRPSFWAATALLSRTYLFMGEYMQAEIEASKIIDQTNLFALESLDNAFLKNNREAIWQLQPVGVDAEANTGEGRLFVLPVDGPDASDFPVYLSELVVQSFEAGDERKIHWVDSIVAGGNTYYYPYKYKVGKTVAPTTEYPTIIRLAEMYLIRAEARTHLNNISNAQEDVDVIRTRAGLPAVLDTDQESLLKIIMHERRSELFTEWGHRWLDLKRTATINDVMTTVTPIKGNTWHPFQALYPIPQREILNSPNITQNPNY